MSDPNIVDRQHRKTVTRRRERANGNTYEEAKPKIIRVRFSRSAKLFVASIALGLKPWIKYRSDDGFVAGGLIMDSDPDGSFYRLFSDAKDREEHNWIEGNWYRIYAQLHRRRAPNPQNRAVIKIVFDRYHTNYDEGEGDEIVPRKPQDLGEELLDWLKTMSKAWRGPTERKIRLIAYVNLAKKVGYPRYLQLWYYDPRTIEAFMRADKKGELVGDPFDPKRCVGVLPGSYQHPPNWRVYPFRDLLQHLKESQYNGEEIPYWRFEQLDVDLHKSLYVALVMGEMSGSLRIPRGEMTEQAKAFQDHIVELKNVPDSLYHVSDRNSAKRPPRFWGRF